METKEWHKDDKTAWGDGPWLNEPDKRQWQDEATGLSCLIVRGPVGALCGYVGVPEGHPAYGLSYDGTPDKDHRAYSAATRAKMRAAFKGKKGAESHEAVREALLDFPEPPLVVAGAGERIAEIDIHGGLTYSGGCSGNICHVVAEGEPDTVWWFGFDCAHFMDLCPKMEMRRRQLNLPMAAAREAGLQEDVYRDVAYVTAECASLAKQLMAMHAP